MDEKTFFSHYPVRKKDSNKYDNGVVLFLSGSYGMAGAAILNLAGAESSGVSYIHSAVSEDIYPIVASGNVCAVYHPYDPDEADVVRSLPLKNADALCFGCGTDRLKHGKRYLEDLLKKCDVPVIVDANGLRILAEDETLYELNRNMILTPHMGEFSALCGMKIEEIMEEREEIASDFAKKHHVILVLKGSNSLVVSAEGLIHVNDSGNEALARAGSGDVLAGMITGLCAIYEDPYVAVKDAVWLHGHLCDMWTKSHSVELLDLLSYPKLADEFFFRRPRK